MSKHTPGPWVVCVQDGDDKAFTIFAESQLEDNRIHAEDWEFPVCRAGLGHKNFEANARLIAAAPELLEFVEEVRRTGDTRLASMAIAVIAKAKGE